MKASMTCSSVGPLGAFTVLLQDPRALPLQGFTLAGVNL